MSLIGAAAAGLMQAAYDLNVNPSPGVQPARPSPQSPSGGSSGPSHSPRNRPDTYTPSRSAGDYQYSVYNGRLTSVSSTASQTSSSQSKLLANPSATSSASGPSPSAGTASSGPLATSAFYGGIPQSILNGLNAYLAQNPSATGSASSAGTIDLGSAIAAAASAGAGDTNWIQNIVSYASTLSPTGAAGLATTSGAATDTSLTNALNSIQSVIQQDTAQVGSYLATQGYSASQVSADVNALNYAYTVDSLGSVAVGIAADTGKAGTVTVSSSIASIDVSGSSATETVDASTVSFSSHHHGDWTQLESASSSDTATVASSIAASGVVADALGTTFSITDRTRHGEVSDSTSSVVAMASETTSTGTSTALIADTSTVAESSHHDWRNDSSTVAQSNSALVLDWSTVLSAPSPNSSASTLYAQQVSSLGYATASTVNVYA